MIQPNTDFDNPWKTIIELYFHDFMSFFFPTIEAEIDWSREITFLDKELQKIVREGEVSKRYADKLVSVWQVNGKQSWVLIHVEVQSQAEVMFPKRMFQYNYRLKDRYDRPVVSLAILGDESSKWRPQDYTDSLWGCRTTFEFPIAKLLDYGNDWKALEANPNPFAVVTMAHLKTKETHNDRLKRKEWKFRLTRMLYDRGYERQDIINLFLVIDWMMQLPDSLAREFNVELENFEEARKVQYVTTIERMGIEKGIELVAMTMMAQQFSIADIIRATGLSQEHIQALQAKREEA